jgi:hypothetical protein
MRVPPRTGLKLTPAKVSSFKVHLLGGKNAVSLNKTYSLPVGRLHGSALKLNNLLERNPLKMKNEAALVGDQSEIFPHVEVN